MTIHNTELDRIHQVKKLEKKIHLYNKLIERCEHRYAKYRKHLKKERTQLRRQYKILTNKKAP